MVIISLLFIFKRPPFAKQIIETAPDGAVDVKKYDGKPELDAGTDTKPSAKPAAEISGTAVEYYPPDKSAVCEIGGAASDVVHEMPGDSPEVQELHAGDGSLRTQSQVASPVSEMSESVLMGA